eukprot:scaffold27146_cov32-Tisochrysis_lutea.AAC.1
MDASRRDVYTGKRSGRKMRQRREARTQPSRVYSFCATRLLPLTVSLRRHGQARADASLAIGAVYAQVEDVAAEYLLAVRPQLLDRHGDHPADGTAGTHILTDEDEVCTELARLGRKVLVMPEGGTDQPATEPRLVLANEQSVGHRGGAPDLPRGWAEATVVEAMEAEETVAEKAAVETKAAARVEEARVVYARGFARILKFYYARASWIGPISISST